jgi:hypothetical protein
MTDDAPIPDPIRRLADARADARASRDFATADRLKAELEAAGWRVADRGFSYRLVPAHPPDVEVGGVTLYGRVESVPSRLGTPASGLATVVMVARATDAAAVTRTLDGLRPHAPPGTDVVVVADDPAARVPLAGVTAATEDGSGSEGRAGMSGLPVEIIGTSVRLGDAAALSIGIRRARGRVVIILAVGVAVGGDIVGPLVRALDDPAVGIAGVGGVVTRDLHRFEPAPGGAHVVDAITGMAMAFRRADAAAAGPLDQRLRTPGRLAIWWSLMLRDAGEDDPPRRAVVVDLPLTAHAHEGPAPGDRVDETPGAADRNAELVRRRDEKRDTYRIADRFGHRRDLASG